VVVAFQAEVDERSTALEMLRQAGFAIYVRRVWRLTGGWRQSAESPGGSVGYRMRRSARFVQ
jgi:hypothetical protein